MSCEPGRRSGRRLAALAAALLLAWPVAAQQPAGGESPHAVLERARAAAEAGDWGELASCLAPADRTRLTWDTILITGMMLDHAFMAEQRLAEEAEASGQGGIPDDEAEPSAGNEEIAARLHALLDDHGVHRVPQDEVLEAEPAEVLAGVDQVSLLPRLMAVLVELTGDEEEEGTEGGMAPIDLPLPAGELTDVVTDGSTARGTIGGQQVEFLQVDGRWYLSLPSEEHARQESTTPADPKAVPRPEEGAETPQTLVERLRQAARDQDFAVAAACLAPDEREEAIVVLSFAPVLLLAAAAEEPSPGDDATVRDLLSLVGEAERIYLPV
ncbi:MAG TPA: hypothetical protein VKU40_02895 [Thermoanaerobaculia bacterium]|nr:hypothetical protein [Thermoanaerobaculia bacterium]